MDPLSLLGGIASAGAIIGGITKTVQGLCTLRSKYSEADLMLGTIISELSVVKAALYQIQDWVDYNKGVLVQEELGEALAVSLNGCKECMDLLAEDVTDMIGDTSPRGAQLLMRTRTVWNEPMMKEHQNRLHHQISALQLLLHAVQVRSLAGQAAIIRQPKARQLIQQVKDDTSTIRVTSRTSQAGVSQRDSITTRTCAESTISDPCLPWLDSQILTSDVYQKHGAAAIARHDEHRPLNSRLDDILEDEPKSPTSTTSSERRQRPQPRIITANLSPPAPKPVILPPQSPALLTPESMPRTPSQYSPLTPITPGGSATRSPLQQSLQRWPIVGSPGAHQQQQQKTSEARPGLRARLRNNLSRASLSPRPPLSASPTSPESSLLRAQRRLKSRGYDRSVEISEGDADVDPMIRAAQMGSSWDIEHLLDRGFDVNTRHIPTGRTVLAVAAHCGHLDTCALLINHDATIEPVDCNDKTPLHLAVEHEHLEVAALLLQHGAKTQTRDQTQNTPLHEAALLNDNDVAKLLLEYGADPLANNLEHQTPLHIAACTGGIEVAESLMAGQRQVDVKGRNGMTPLMQAAAAGKTAMVGLFLRKKASLKAKCTAGWQPLHHAASNGHADVVDLFLSKKHPIDARTDDGRTPLMLSAGSSFSATDLLLRKAAQLHLRCSSSKQAIHYASEANNLPIIRLLLESRAGVNSEGPLKLRPIHIAASIGSVEQLETLLRYGADVDARNAAGDRPLCIAAAGGQVAIVTMLLDHGAAPTQAFSSTNSLRDSPLCIACKHGNLDVAVSLLSRGATVNERDVQGWRPLRHAIYNARPEIVEMLLANGATSANADYPYDSFTCFSLFAPGTASEDPRVSQIKTMLQLAKARERVQGDTATMGELEDPTPKSAWLRDYTHSHSPYIMDPPRDPQGPHNDQRGARNATATWSLTSPTTLMTPLESHLPAPSIISPVTDSTYHIHWPWSREDREYGNRQGNITENQRMSSITSSISPLTSGAIAAAAAAQSSTPVSPMTLHEREQLRRMRCVACTGMGRGLPDLTCNRCRQNVMHMTRGQQGTQASIAAVAGQTSDPHIYEMDATQ